MSDPLEASDDALLATRAAGGSREAFRRLYQRHRVEVYRYLTRWLGSESLAEDALQEVFLQVYRSLGRYDRARPFRGWLYGVVRNVAQNARRKQRKVAPPGCEGHDSGLFPTLARRERAADLQAAFTGLPEETRALLLQRYRLELTLDELAEAWGCTNRTIRNRLHAANDRLVQAIVAQRAGGTA